MNEIESYQDKIKGDLAEELQKAYEQNDFIKANEIIEKGADASDFAFISTFTSIALKNEKKDPKLIKLLLDNGLSGNDVEKSAILRLLLDCAKPKILLILMESFYKRITAYKEISMIDFLIDKGRYELVQKILKENDNLELKKEKFSIDDILDLMFEKNKNFDKYTLNDCKGGYKAYMIFKRSKKYSHLVTGMNIEDVPYGLVSEIAEKTTSIQELKDVFETNRVFLSILENKIATEEMIEKIADDEAIDYAEMILEHPNTSLKTKDQLNRFLKAKEINLEGDSIFNESKYERAIEVYNKSLNILRSLYKENEKRWADFYAVILYNLASSYDNLNNLDTSFELYEQVLKVKRSDNQISDKTLYSCLGTVALRQKNYKVADICFEQYFSLLKIKEIYFVKDIYEFIYPFVKYYQVNIYLDNQKKLKSLKKIASEAIEYFISKFKDKYKEQIGKEHQEYLGLKNPDNSINEKIEIFEKIFIK